MRQPPLVSFQRNQPLIRMAKNQVLSFSHGALSLIINNNQIKKRDFPLFISMYGSQIMRASSPICSPSM